MRTIILIFAFACYAAAHSSVWEIEFDGTLYPARDARMDAQLGAKRIEWTYTNNIGTSGKPEPWQAIVNVSDPGITCTPLSFRWNAHYEANVDIQVVSTQSPQR